VTLVLIPAIHRLTHAIAVELDATPGLDLSQAEAHVMAHLAAQGDSTASAIHRAFGHKKSTLTAVLDRLEARGLIARHGSVRDRRSIDVGLTEEGRGLARRAHERLVEIEGALWGRLSRAERALLARSLDHAAARPHPAKGPSGHSQRSAPKETAPTPKGRARPRTRDRG
jgi:DNA-binding MarR family transcriptional regulator